VGPWSNTHHPAENSLKRLPCDQLLELGEVICARLMDANHLLELCAYGSFKLFKVDILFLRLFEPFRQRIEVEFRQINDGSAIGVAAIMASNVRSIGGYKLPFPIPQTQSAFHPHAQ
jgi:hypothetical protein